MSPCYRPRLGAAETEAIKASTELRGAVSLLASWASTTEFWPFPPTIHFGRQCLLQGDTGEVLEGRELAKSEGDRCR